MSFFISILSRFGTHFYLVEMHARFDRKWKNINKKKQINTFTHTHMHPYYIHTCPRTKSYSFHRLFFFLRPDSFICHSVVCIAKVFAKNVTIFFDVILPCLYIQIGTQYSISNCFASFRLSNLHVFRFSILFGRGFNVYICCMALTRRLGRLWLRLKCMHVFVLA